MFQEDDVPTDETPSIIDNMNFKMSCNTDETWKCEYNEKLKSAIAKVGISLMILCLTVRNNPRDTFTFVQ